MAEAKKKKMSQEETEILVDRREDREEGEGACLEIGEEKRVEDEIRELNNRYLRVCADYDNFRRRSRQEGDNRYEEGIIETIRSLMPVVDSIEGALKAAEDCRTDEAKEFAEGLVLIAQQLKESLGRLGVTEIPGLGAAFDPNVHQVVIHEEDGDLPENTITEVYQKGYVKGNRVIRHSMVKVVN